MKTNKKVILSIVMFILLWLILRTIIMINPEMNTEYTSEFTEQRLLSVSTLVSRGDLEAVIGKPFTSLKKENGETCANYSQPNKIISKTFLLNRYNLTYVCFDNQNRYVSRIDLTVDSSFSSVLFGKE